MAKDTETAVGGGEFPGTAPPLPDLSGVDLRTLRLTPRAQLPGLAAAVDHVLANPAAEHGGWNNHPDPNPNPLPGT
ncbi:hypothetical protein [Streptomyces sulphureus]|uniref:hypothetical protein n=1 Tax=Streptomyces sulphureus TaxID=47758 RepID=UPI000376D227|nr:hypothetical protein [Streptomyces sulphureus]